MEIKIKIPKEAKTVKKKVEVDREKFDLDLITFLDELENGASFNQALCDKLLDYGINKKVFDDMISRMDVFASYDENKNDIGFPYEDWIDRLLTIEVLSN